MTDYNANVEQAKRAFDAAKNALDEAKKAYADAQTERLANEYAAKGIKPGDRVTITTKANAIWGERKENAILRGFEDTSRWSPRVEPVFVKIKKNGEASQFKVGFSEYNSSVAPYDGDTR